jgi:hypothetical protein
VLGGWVGSIGERISCVVLLVRGKLIVNALGCHCKGRESDEEEGLYVLTFYYVFHKGLVGEYFQDVLMMTGIHDLRSWESRGVV